MMTFLKSHHTRQRSQADYTFAVADARAGVVLAQDRNVKRFGLVSSLVNRKRDNEQSRCHIGSPELIRAPKPALSNRSTAIGDAPLQQWRDDLDLIGHDAAVEVRRQP